MWIPREFHWRRAVFWLTLFVLAGLAGATLLVVSGIYNVAASARHFHITEQLISFALNRSIRFYSPSGAPDTLDEVELARLGARHFQYGCAPCHGAPGAHENAVMQHMYPAPPDLSHAALKWDAAELNWIVYNGLKFTGMPAWMGRGRKDEVWALVAFLRRMPDMSEAEYARMSDRQHAPRISGPSASGDHVTTAFCTSCHGDAQTPPVASTVPTLNGQPVPYLTRALQAYRRNQRQSGIMEPIAAMLDDRRIGELAQHFASLPRDSKAMPPPLPENVQALIARGAQIANAGDRRAAVPPCLSCHGETGSALFPRLRGLSRQYIAGQLNLFRSGIRSGTAYADIMAVVANRLSDEQIDAVAAYLSQATGAETTR